MVTIDPGLTLTLGMELELSSIETFLDHLRFAVRDFQWPAVTAIQLGPQNKRVPCTETDLVKTLELVPTLIEVPKQVTIQFATISSVSWGQRADGRSFHLSISAKPHEQVFREPADCVRVGTHVSRRLLGRGIPVKGAVDRNDAGVCVPFVPLAKTRRPLVIASVADIEAAYERPEDFLSAWTVEEFGERRLLTRCQDAVSKGEVLREIIDHQWQMARAARSKLTKYAAPVVADDERETYEAGEPRLVPVGRDASTNLVEYSCALRRGEHLRGFEIYYLRSLVQDKRMQDGTPVSAVRVVFAEQRMAEEEKQPLLDNGIEVFYEDDAGELGTTGTG